jgi:hypothetical protein
MEIEKLYQLASILSLLPSYKMGPCERWLLNSCVNPAKIKVKINGDEAHPGDNRLNRP